MTTSAQGKHSRRSGADAERDLARWLLPWWPDAKRGVVNGWVSRSRRVADPGDLDGTSPGIFWSVKAWSEERIGPWTAELDAKRGARLGLLVVRRNRHPDPGDWWCWLRLVDLADLLTVVAWSGLDGWVRLELRSLMPLLVAGGYARSPR